MSNSVRWFRIEERIDSRLVAEKIEPHRLVEACRKQIENAAAHAYRRVRARLRRGYSRCAPARHDGVHRHDMAGRDRQRLRGDGSARGHRCTMALTVVSTISGLSLPTRRASRASVVSRCARMPPCGDTRS